MRNILVDTGALVALFRAHDAHHEAVKAALQTSRPLLLSTWSVITEVCHLLTREGQRAVLNFIRRGALRIEEVSNEDIPRLDELLGKYDSMDLSEASLVLISEKTGVNEVLTVDSSFVEYRTESGRRFKLVAI